MAANIMISFSQGTRGGHTHDTESSTIDSGALGARPPVRQRNQFDLIHMLSFPISSKSIGEGFCFI